MWRSSFRAVAQAQLIFQQAATRLFTAVPEQTVTIDLSLAK
jgi:hypothetical protein